MTSRRGTILASVSILVGTLLFFEAGTTQEVCKDPRKIVGGEDAEIKDYPWQVALLIDGTLCGGTIYHQSWVLTAAHCFDRTKDPLKVRAKAGVTNYKTMGAWISAERIVVHDKYDASTPATQPREHDLALVKLKTVPLGTSIPPARPDLQLKPCDLLEISGWGRTKEGGQRAEKLQRALVPYIDNDTCKEPYGEKIRPSMMCAGLHEGGIDACQGDSGGPLVARRKTEGNVLVGVVSWGEGCARARKFGIYTRVTPYRQWISDVILASEKK